MIIINCSFLSETTDMNDFFKILGDEGLIAASRAEKGCVKYDFYINLEETKQMMLVEHWETMDDLQAHSETDLFQKFRPICKANGVKTRLAMYEE